MAAQVEASSKAQVYRHSPESQLYANMYFSAKLSRIRAFSTTSDNNNSRPIAVSSGNSIRLAVSPRYIRVTNQQPTNNISYAVCRSSWNDGIGVAHTLLFSA